MFHLCIAYQLQAIACLCIANYGGQFQTCINSRIITAIILHSIRIITTIIVTALLSGKYVGKVTPNSQCEVGVPTAWSGRQVIYKMVNPVIEVRKK